MLRHYLTLRASGVPISFTAVMGMALRGTLTLDLVASLVVNQRSALNWPITELEAHYLAGGKMANLVNAGVVLKAADVSIDRRFLMAAALAGVPVLELAKAFIDLRERFGDDLSFGELLDRCVGGEDVLADIRDGTFVPRSRRQGWLVRVELGPMTGRELVERVQVGEIRDDAQVRDPDRGDWMSLDTALHRLRGRRR